MSTSLRTRTYKLLNEPEAEHVPALMTAYFIAFMIILNVLEVILSTLGSFAAAMGQLSFYASYVFALFFSLEFAFRVWAAADTPHEKKLTAWSRRWLYVRSPMGLVDLLSSLPMLVLLILPMDQFEDLRIIKLIALIRVLKLTRYSSSLNTLVQVFHDNKHTLVAAILVMLIMMVMAASGIYLFERELQPENFGSIPDSMWWAFVTLTTVGYGDVVPLTFGGKVFGVLVMVCGVGIAAMPAGIFASSFVQLVREQEKERRYLSRIKHKSTNVAGKGAASELSHFHLSMSEQREVNYLMEEFGLTLEQAVGVVSHFRHAP